MLYPSSTELSRQTLEDFQELRAELDEADGLRVEANGELFFTFEEPETGTGEMIGIVAAIGGAPRGIGSVFLITGTVVGVLGSLLGVLAGYLSSIWLNPVNDWFYRNFEIEIFPRHLFDLQGVPCHLEPSWVVAVAIGAVLLAVLVALIPAGKASRMNPVTALAFE